MYPRGSDRGIRGALADRTFRLKDGRIAEEHFPKAVAKVNGAYEAWLAKPGDTTTEGAFNSAVERMIEAAPAGRKLSAANIRERYADAIGLAGFETALRRLNHHDHLLESE